MKLKEYKMHIKIDKPIVSAEVITPEQEVVDTVAKRPEKLTGTTYKVKDEGRNISVYITINDKGGKPFELFLNSSHTESHEYVTVITRLVSAMLREGMCPEFIAKEFKQIWGANGYFAGGKFRSSLISHIGDVILDHVKQKTKPEKKSETQENKSQEVQGEEGKKGADLDINTGVTCPECKQPTLKKEGGCTKCLNDECGYLGECG